MKRIHIIVSEQFGKNTDIVKYADYLSTRYDVSILTFDYGNNKIDTPSNVNVTYVSHTSNPLINAILFFSHAFAVLFFTQGFIFIECFPHCNLLPKILFWKRMHVDVRTLSVHRDTSIRKKQNLRLQNDVNAFYSASFISEGVQQQLDLRKNLRTFILPLGGDIRSTNDKEYDDLKLLYIGTLLNRNIEQTLQGVHQFHTLHPEISLRYDVVGGGDDEQENIIRKYVADNHLEDIIKIHGQMPYNELGHFYERCNVGLSYVPIEEYYQFQPPTKTYEYILSGLFCLATNTYSNRQVINSQNGILHDDNPNAIVTALELFWEIRKDISSKTVRETLHDSEWMTLLRYKLQPIIEYRKI